MHAMTDEMTFVEALKYALKHDHAYRTHDFVLKIMLTFPDKGEAIELPVALQDDQRAQFMVLAKRKGVSNRGLARCLGISEATVRRNFATFDALARGKPNEINGSESENATNVASPALAAILRNLPKLTAADRAVVCKELDIAAEEARPCLRSR